MLKNYFSVRVYVIVDLCLLTLWLVSGVDGWATFAKYPYIAAGVWLVLTVPLASIGLLSVYQRVQLHHRKNVHTQYEYEQQAEIRLEQMRQQYTLPSPTSTIEQENEADVRQVSQGVPSGVPLSQVSQTSQNVPLSQTKIATKPEEYNVTVAYYLGQYPAASIREVERATGIPKANIGRTPAWQNRPNK